MKNILITGSGGFLFSNFIRQALYKKSGYNFVSIDACKSANVLNNFYVNKGHKFHMGDVADKHIVNAIFELERPDIVIHGASESLEDTTDISSFFHSNILGTQVIIEACLKWKIEHLLHVSTDKVYGPLKEQDPPWTELSPTNAQSSYATSKIVSEFLVQNVAKNTNLKCDIVRLSNIYGQRQSLKKFIPKIVASILKNQEISIYGKGMQLREWTHVEDVYTAIMKILELGGTNQIYNVSSGQEFSNLEVFHEVCSILDQGDGLLKFVEGHSSHTGRYATDASKLKNLGWKPTYKFRSGLKHCVSWFENNKWFLN